MRNRLSSIVLRLVMTLLVIYLINENGGTIFSLEFVGGFIVALSFATILINIVQILKERKTDESGK